MNHTIMVTLVGQEILRGKHTSEGGVTPRDWLHFTISLLCHDIGYVRGVCRGDRDGQYVCTKPVISWRISAGATDATLTPYHVARSKLFVRERFGKVSLTHIDTREIEANIEHTRFPGTGRRAAYQHGRLSRPASCRRPDRSIGRHQLFAQDVCVICRIPGNRREREARISERRMICEPRTRFLLAGRPALYRRCTPILACNAGGQAVDRQPVCARVLGRTPGRIRRTVEVSSRRVD